jgi:ATP phosphoribosyltransferase
MDKIKFAIPKGSLQQATTEFFNKSGFKLGSMDRTYRPSINDPQIEIKVLRPQEIPVFVSEGLQDIGITGEDWVKENRADVEILQNLEYGKIRLVIAVPKEVQQKDMNEYMEYVWSQDKNFRVSTEYLNIASEYPNHNRTIRNASAIKTQCLLLHGGEKATIQKQKSSSHSAQQKQNRRKIQTALWT